MRRVDYVILYVDDLDRSVGFYRDVLGLAVKLRQPEYAEFETENVKLGLFPRSILRSLIGRDATAGGPGGEILFLVDDVDSWGERLRRSGVRALAGPVDHPWGHRSVHLADPDGFVVELAQEIPRPAT
jgi:lactoylglutathione lyase